MRKIKQNLIEFIFQNPKNNEIQKIYFQDSRRFGTFSFYDDISKKLNEIGPDLYELEDLEIFKKRIVKGKKRPICEVLMDQKIISGIGNYLRADILYHCKIHPFTETLDLSDDDLESLFDSIKYIINTSVKSSATTCGYYESSIAYGHYDCLIYGKKLSPCGRQVVTIYDSEKRNLHWVPSLFEIEE